ncbi:MAG: pyruvate dehydrogenase (acetyl-transferring) E1 component subunit alpha [Balneolales bacterium]
MGNETEVAGFTPTGAVYKSTKLPKPTRKTHKSLGIKEDELLGLYECMYRQRRFEERAAQMYQKGKFGGFLHLYIGQEALSSGLNYALNDDDDIITAYRDHGMGLARGISAKAGMAELFGKASGCSNGKGGSMHFFDVKNHFWGGHAIVGAHVPLGGGIALANKMRNEEKVTVCLFGDGAVDQGSLNESLNLAQLWKLPVIYVIENNGYSMGTAVQRHSAGELVDRALPYGMKHDVISGMDLLTVIDKFRDVAEEVRKDSMPWLIEVRTYRYRGHSMSDPANYRSKEELQEFKSYDPIERLKTYILERDLFDEKKLDEINGNIDEEILEAIDFAENSDFPDDEELYKHIYADDDFPYLR